MNKANRRTFLRQIGIRKYKAPVAHRRFQHDANVEIQYTVLFRSQLTSTHRSNFELNVPGR